jgi:hypothetical protein
MTIAELYRYPTGHFDFHEQQLALGDSETIECEAPYLFGGIVSLSAADLWTSSITPLTAATSNTPPWIRADPPGGSGSFRQEFPSDLSFSMYACRAQHFG